MYHSRAAALLTGDYADRTVDVGVIVSIPALSGVAVNATYTVGANVIAVLEFGLLRVNPSAAIAQAQIFIDVNRNGIAIRVLEIFSIVGALSYKDAIFQMILLPGDVVRVQSANADAANVGAVGDFFAREIDL